MFNFLKKKTDGQNGTPSGTGGLWARALGFTLVSAVLLGILVYGGWQIKKTVDSYKNSWAEIQFAVNPATNGIVKKARETYETRVASVAGDIVVTDQKKPADKLVEAVIEQIDPKK